MAFTINIGTCSCENEVVDKDGKIRWSGGDGISAVMVNTDILNPVLKVSGSYSGGNYVKIDEFGRFYFVESVESLAGGHCLLRCHVDVLYSYCSSIKGLTCLVSRNEFQENPYLVDTLLPIERQFTVYSKYKNNSDLCSPAGIYAYFLVKIAN